MDYNNILWSLTVCCRRQSFFFTSCAVYAALASVLVPFTLNHLILLTAAKRLSIKYHLHIPTSITTDA